MIKRILKIIGKTLLIVIAVLIIVIFVGRIITKEKYKIEGENSIYESTYVDINGLKQYILIKGENVNNPVILWLHGGPGSPDSFEDYKFVQYLIDDYTVVCYDQRGCGATYFKNIDIDPNNETTSFEQAIEDVDALVDYLRDRFNQEKIIVVGHSYGTILGTNYVAGHQDKVSCYVGVGTAVGGVQGYILGYEDAMKIATDNGEDTSKLEEAYNKYLDDPSLENLLNVRITAAPYHTGKKEKSTLTIAKDMILSPDLHMPHVRWYLKQLNYDSFYNLNKNLMDVVMDVNCDLIREAGSNFTIPIGLINGDADWYTPASMVEEYYQEINAPKKGLKIMEECGHGVAQFDDPGGFAEVLKEMLASFEQ